MYAMRDHGKQKRVDTIYLCGSNALIEAPCSQKQCTQFSLENVMYKSQFRVDLFYK